MTTVPQQPSQETLDDKGVIVASESATRQYAEGRGIPLGQARIELTTRAADARERPDGRWRVRWSDGADRWEVMMVVDVQPGQGTSQPTAVITYLRVRREMNRSFAANGHARSRRKA